MGILEALEIEKLQPVLGGIYVCVDAEKKKFEIVSLNEIKVDFNGKKEPLKTVLKKMYTSIANLEKSLSESNKEIDSLKKIIVKNQLNNTEILKRINESLEIIKQEVF